MAIWKLVVLASVLLWPTGCGDDDGGTRCAVTEGLPGGWVVTAPGITLEVQRAPYQIAISDRDGNQLLTSQPGGDGSGYSGAAWTTGLVSYDRLLSPGYTLFYPTLDPWRDRSEVVSAVVEPEEITVVLADPDDAEAPCVTVAHKLRESALRVEATLDGETPRAWSAAFDADDTEEAEAYIGFGERFNKTNQAGNDVYSWSEEGGIGTGEGTSPGPSNPEPNGALMTYYPVPPLLQKRALLDLAGTIHRRFDDALRPPGMRGVAGVWPWIFRKWRSSCLARSVVLRSGSSLLL